MKYPKYFKLSIITMLALSLVTIAIHIYLLIHNISLGASYALNIAYLIMFALCSQLCIMLLSAKYIVSQTHLLLKMWFFDFTRKKIAINKIVNIKNIKSEGKLYLSYIDEDNLDPIIVLISINSKLATPLSMSLISTNNNIVYNEEN